MVYRSTSCNKSCRNRPRRHSSSSFVFKSFSVSFPFLHWSVITYSHMKREGNSEVEYFYVEKLWYRLCYLNEEWVQRTTSRMILLQTVANLGRSPVLLEVNFSFCHLWDNSASSAPGRGEGISTRLWLWPLDCCFVFLVV